MNKLLITLLVLILKTSIASSAIWWEGTTGDWENPANWQCNCVPGPGEPVYISVNSTVTINESTVVGSLFIYANSSVTIDSTVEFQTYHITNFSLLYNYGTITIPSSNENAFVNWVDASFDNYGELNIQNVSNGYGIHNLGIFNNDTAGIVTLTNINTFDGIYNYGGTFTNKNDITITTVADNGFANQAYATFNNEGYLSISDITLSGIWSYDSSITNSPDGEIYLSDIQQKGMAILNNSTFVNNGFVQLGEGISGDAIGCNLGSSFNNNNGHLKGKGYIYYCTSSLSGEITPGLSPGTLTFEPNMNFTGVFNFEIAGNAGAGVASGHDRINIIGSATLGGTLNLELIDNFEPSVNDSYTIVHCNNGCSGTFDNINLPVNNASWQVIYNTNDVIIKLTGSLPVELMAFSVKNVTDYNELTWQTATETNNTGFHIQKSKNGSNWQNITFIEGQGTALTPTHYQYIDKRPVEGVNYYRLKQVDFDGAERYSQIVNCFYKGDYNQLIIFPNPAKNTIELLGIDFESPKEVIIYNQVGQVVLRKEVEDAKIDVSLLLGGLYFLEMEVGGRRIWERLVVE